MKKYLIIGLFFSFIIHALVTKISINKYDVTTLGATTSIVVNLIKKEKKQTLKSKITKSKNTGPTKALQSTKQQKLNKKNSESNSSIEAQVKGQIRPNYPYLSRIKKESGIVTLSYKIKNNKAFAIEIIESSGFDRLDQAAILALKKASLNFNQKRPLVLDTFKISVEFNLM